MTAFKLYEGDLLIHKKQEICKLLSSKKLGTLFYEQFSEEEEDEMDYKRFSKMISKLEKEKGYK